ncbi:MAG: pantoate--beta-alanine ligase [Saprospiraceae bacterium]|nr:pantoate--beta-alanine ligase [Saprospiraceae bacterium]
MILVANTLSQLNKMLEQFKSRKRSIGFVPTMGALHEGHLRLVRKCKKENDICIVSIFVNPTQFNDPKDLEKYPRDLNADIAKLISAGADLLFAPEANEIYPNGTENGQKINLGGLDKQMEGLFRPGHFEGVAQVVKRLLDIVQPHKLYMGLKDFQQAAIIGHVIRTLKINTELILCSTVREKNGLAMSSRNERLNPELREKAGLIYQTLKNIKRYKARKNPNELLEYGLQKLNVDPFKVEYLVIADGHTLNPIDYFISSDYPVCLVAVQVGDVRLIDNIIL